ncbi:MAG TPA: hypothetical protein VFP69_18890 [Streptomyces sp.]|nr:hypothetical protein [Streptomyces sp.]
MQVGAETFIAVAATVIALGSLWVSYAQTRATRLHNRQSVRRRKGGSGAVPGSERIERMHGGGGIARLSCGAVGCWCAARSPSAAGMPAPAALAGTTAPAGPPCRGALA